MPPEGPREIAFAGRSNVGKSSAINAIAGRRRLAFISKTPGRTQTLNFFSLPDGARLVDLPGYGYAKVAKSQRAGWEALVGGYLAGRAALAGVVLIMDARLPATPNDRGMLAWLAPIAHARGVSLLTLLSKADKLTRTEQARALASAREALVELGLDTDCQLLSSKTGQGVEEARNVLVKWLAPRGEAGNKAPPAKEISPGAKRLNKELRHPAQGGEAGDDSHRLKVRSSHRLKSSH